MQRTAHCGKMKNWCVSWLESVRCHFYTQHVDTGKAFVQTRTFLGCCEVVASRCWQHFILVLLWYFLLHRKSISWSVCCITVSLSQQWWCLSLSNVVMRTNMYWIKNVLPNNVHNIKHCFSYWQFFYSLLRFLLHSIQTLSGILDKFVAFLCDDAAVTYISVDIICLHLYSLSYFSVHFFPINFHWVNIIEVQRKY